MSIAADDVVVRFLRLHAGRRVGRPSSSRDALEITSDAQDVMIDHVSARFGVDEIATINGCNVTVQWSVLAWGLGNAGHVKGAHSKGLLAKGMQRCGISLLRNMLAHAADRMPDIERFGSVQIVNNVFYNADSEFGEFYAGDNEVVRVNYMGNIVRAGPATVGKIPAAVNLKPTATGLFSFYAADNIVPPDGRLLVQADEDFRVEGPLDMPAVGLWESGDVLSNLAPTVGASVPFRDSADHKAVSDVIDFGGDIIDSPAGIAQHETGLIAWRGGSTSLRPCAAPVDGDADGIPDYYEGTHRLLDPGNGADGARDLDGNGYTELEDWLSGLAAGIVPC